MRKKEGYSKAISVRDMFAGGLSQSCKRMSAICDQLLVFIAGKMTPVMQITEATKAVRSLRMRAMGRRMRLRRLRRRRGFLLSLIHI